MLPLYWYNVIVTIILVFTTPGSCDNLLRSLDVPHYTFASGSATLKCFYDMSNTRLYSLKWYHNNTEFYRYVPTERNGPVNIGPTNIFMLHEVSRDESHVAISLSKLKPAASGTYTCEVLAEHPSFRTESLSSFMSVLAERLSPPHIKASREVYDTSEQITVGCEPRNTLTVDQRLKIRWFLDGRQVPPSKTEKYGYTADGGYKGVSLDILGQQILDSGGSVVVECVLTLGDFEERASRTLRVKMEHKSLASAPSEDNSATVASSTCLVYLVLLVVLLLHTRPTSYPNHSS